MYIFQVCWLYSVIVLLVHVKILLFPDYLRWLFLLDTFLNHLYWTSLPPLANIFFGHSKRTFQTIILILIKQICWLFLLSIFIHQPEQTSLPSVLDKYHHLGISTRTVHYIMRTLNGLIFVTQNSFSAFFNSIERSVQALLKLSLEMHLMYNYWFIR